MSPELLKLARKRLGLTQVEAARQLRVSQPYWSLIEKGERPMTAEVARRAVRVLGMPAALLPADEDELDSALGSDQLAKEVSALGYPGFAYMEGGTPRNPGEVLLRVLAQDRIEARLAEALPWVALHHGAGLDREWLVRQVRLRNLSNRLGFVVALAKGLAARCGASESENYAALASLEKELQRSRLADEDTFGQELSDTEREWVRQNRTPEAAYWNVLSDWRPEQLQYA